MQVVTIEITNRCPLNCPSCFIDKEAERNMDLTNFEKILEKLPKNIEAITLTGGDPFTLNNIPRYCDACNDHEIKPTVFSSGFINHELISELRGKVKKIHVNLKYPNQLDDIWKGKKGAFEHVLNFLNLCRKNSTPTYINWVVDKTNLFFVRDMINIAVEYKAKLLVLPFIAYDKRYIRNRIPYKFYCRYFSTVKSLNPLVEMGVECDICKAGVTRMNISVLGDVNPCIYLPHLTFGNIFEDDLEEIIGKMHEWREEKGMCGCIAQD